MGKSVFITGTSSGIGRASVERFAAAGWDVTATMLDPAAYVGMKPDPNVLVTRLDVCDQNSIRDAVAAGIERFGRIDVLVNNAGYGQYGVFEAIPREKVIEQFEVNVFGLMDVTRTVLPFMRQAGSGVIVNLSSGAGIFTFPMISLYAATKFAIEGFSESLSFELAALGIVVKIVEPHGGISGTSFNQRTTAESRKDTAPSDYTAFIERNTAVFAHMLPPRLIDSSDVANVIYAAASDGTDRLRYLAGHDERGFIRARREMNDDVYIAFLRKMFKG